MYLKYVFKNFITKVLKYKKSIRNTSEKLFGFFKLYRNFKITVHTS